MTDSHYHITRRIYTAKQLRETYIDHPSPNVISRLKHHFYRFNCLSTLSNLFPFYHILASFYTWRSFGSDIFAGLTMCILHIPQGMAYGHLAGLKPINGLYTSFFPALMYFFFGTSRHVSIGTFSVVALLSSEPVDRLTASYMLSNTTMEVDESDYRLKISVTVTILAGLIQLAMGLFHLGFLVVYISPPLLSGFTCASAFHVLLSQLNGLFGIQMKSATGPGRLPYTVYNFFAAITTIHLVTTLISTACILILVAFRFFLNPRIEAKIRFPFPVELIVITKVCSDSDHIIPFFRIACSALPSLCDSFIPLIIATVVSYFVQLEAKYNVRIVGPLPNGLPQPVLPDFTIVPEIFLEAVIVSLVAVTTTVSLVKLYATRFGYGVHYTQEMLALGMSNIFGGFLRCHTASAALARTSVSVNAGMQSQIASLISCVMLLLVLTVIGPVLQSVPMCVLSSLITVSLTGVFAQVMDIPKLYRISTFDLLIWIVTFVSTVLIDVPLGLVVGLAFSLLTVLYRTQVSFGQELGWIEHTDLYVDKHRYSTAKRLPGVRIFRFGGPLYYASAQHFHDWVVQQSGIDPNRSSTSPATKASRICTACITTDSRLSKYGDAEQSSAPGELEITLVEKNRASGATDSTERVQFIILDISPWTFIDAVGARILVELLKAYKKVGVEVLCTSCRPQIRATLGNSGLPLDDFDATCYATIHDAVLYARSKLQITSTSADVTMSDNDPSSSNCIRL